MTEDGWYQSDGRPWTIQRFSVSGRLEAEYRVDTPARAAGPGIDAFKRARMTKAPPGQESMWTRWLNTEIPYPDEMPGFDQLLVDASGWLWARVTPTDHQLATHWLVFGSDGGLETQVAMPAGFHPHTVSGHRVIGVWTDDLDVQFVRVYRLVRP